MKLFTKAALGALMLAGAAIGTTAPAAAHVSVGIGIGVPGPYYGPPPGYAYCDRYSRWYDPYRCDSYYDNYYYGGPVFVDGIFFGGGYGHGWHGGWHGGHGWGGGHGGGWSGHGGGHGGWSGGHHH
jgi:hypothetical protein